MAEVTLTAAMRNNLAQLRVTNMLMDQTQNRIATGNKVNSALDDPTAFFKSKGLKDDAGDLSVLKDNMGQTISSIQAADKAITSITELVEQAKSLANSAKSETSASERLSLAAQFDDIRAQIDTLAADASYGGQNLVSGRGTITGGSFLDTTATAESALSGVSSGGLVRTGTDTNVGDFTIATQAKVNSLNTVATGAADITTTLTASIAVDVYVNGVSVGSVTTVSNDGAQLATDISALSTEITATTDGNGYLSVTMTEGNVLELRTTSAIHAQLAGDFASAGLVNDSTGATVVDLTSDLGIYGAEVYAHISGHTDNTDTNVTFSVSGTTLTVTDGTGSSATMSTTVFAAAGTDTLAIGDLTVNFVTSTATEQTNAAPVVTASQAAIGQVSKIAFAAGAYEIGDEITVVVNGTSYAYALTATAADETAAALAWEVAMDADILADESITLSQSGATITFTADTAGDDFSITATQSAAVTDTEGDPTVSTASLAQETTITLSDTFDGTDVLRVTYNAVNYDYTATGGTGTAVTITTMADNWEAAHAANLATALGSGSAVTAVDGVISVTDSNSTFTAPTVTITDNAGGGTPAYAISTLNANVAQAATVAIQANVDDGDVYTAIVNGTTISYTALSTDTTETLIAAGLTAAINANTTLVDGTSGVIQTATVSGATITISENNAGTALNITASAADAAITLGNASATSSTQALKSLTSGTADGDMRVQVTSGGVTETVDVSTSSTTAATISNSAWGSTFTFTADDATMVAGESSDFSVTNPTGQGENDAQVVFNTDGTSTINVQAVDITASGLSITDSVGDWATNANIDATLSELDTAKTALRSNSKTMATSLGVIQTRETFTENFIDNLRVGADKLTLANGSEEATNMLMLQTRQQLGIQALSMASQSSQSILSLFR